ncbi:PAS domain-containing sensor histidine kinase [Chenggangzhangella methanolivorans]|uniref:histidine kinase n=1 Tax=Chenggangzhangella methanolivorans TaxID=1437009 RepID=A0A9E6RGV5_9HYPH|nr:ATP-binding protein [Chenggangzhangella methanolivorans]QZO01221.1 PAS-domain containing protein [Chenggangzhangella methanolivorans]
MSARSRSRTAPPAFAAAAAGVALASSPAQAAALGASEAAALSLFLGAIFVAVTASVLLLRARHRLATLSDSTALAERDLRSRLDRAEAELAADDRVTVTWAAGATEPVVVGDASRIAGLTAGRRLLAFGAWLDPKVANALEDRIAALRERGEPFRLMLPTVEGGHLEADGRPIGAAVTLRLRDVTGERLARAEIEADNAELRGALARLTALVEALIQPVWLRDDRGRLVYANEAYARAVEAKDGVAATDAQAEFLDQADRAAARRTVEAGHVFRKRAPAVFAGQRRIFDVVEAPSEGGSAAIAVDVSELEDVRADLSRQMDAHRRTLDELTTAVAIFRANGALAFHNQAFAQLWALDPAFLESGPSDAAVLDRLRADRKLPEEADFRTWKAALHQAYQAIEAREHWWHLPDRRTIRVVAAPNPQGGVTYLFDDVTERLALESRFNALLKVQSETIDHLKEAVAVFGSDGRLRLHNPAFETLWKLSPAALEDRPHAEQVLGACGARHADPALWSRLKMAMTAMPEERKPVAARIDLDDGAIVDVVTLPLPDGGTLTTFTDVSASVNVERALRDRAEALEAADRLKDDFVKNVSYELRAPLTNTIGFGQLLGDPRMGELNTKQKEYVDHIVSSASALLAIINDILDLATIDAGAMELDRSPVDPRAAIDAAVEGVRDRLAEAGLGLEIEVAPNVGTFEGDPKRVRQILFNLLANAIGFSKPGVAVLVSAMRENNEVVLRVADRGAGIPPERLERVFDRFESQSAGSHARGVGLGLSIVRSLVELHGGTVALQSAPGEGTVVTCRFPVGGAAIKAVR